MVKSPINYTKGSISDRFSDQIMMPSLLFWMIARKLLFLRLHRLGYFLEDLSWCCIVTGILSFPGVLSISFFRVILLGSQPFSIFIQKKKCSHFSKDNRVLPLKIKKNILKNQSTNPPGPTPYYTLYKHIRKTRAFLICI